MSSLASFAAFLAVAAYGGAYDRYQGAVAFATDARKRVYGFLWTHDGHGGTYPVPAPGDTFENASEALAQADAMEREAGEANDTARAEWERAVAVAVGDVSYVAFLDALAAAKAAPTAIERLRLDHAARVSLAKARCSAA